MKALRRCYKKLFIPLICIFMAVPLVSAQEPAAPVVFKNLQVLPANTDPLALLGEMEGFIGALGVNCGYCHAPLESDEDVLDFPSDALPTKRIAREMLRMRQTINQTVVTATGKAADEATRVECATCHKGMPIPPRPLVDVLDDAISERGHEGAREYYRELREQYYGSQVYDFSDGELADGDNRTDFGSLGPLAIRLSARGQAAQAVEWLRMSLDYYPDSVFTWSAMSFMQRNSGDVPAAIESIEKALSLDPDNKQLQERLEVLNGL